MLYIVATPIGNLKDITLRALEILSSCDLILCEDTRKTTILLKHYKIEKKPLLSYHKFCEKSKLKKILSFLKEGKNIALVSDAGTPIISDPGLSLVDMCKKENILFEAIPGACSIIQAIVLSGYSSIPFQFLGFIEKKEKEIETSLKKMLFYPGMSIAFISPHRLIKILEILSKLSSDTKAVLLRELTKKFEEKIEGTAEELIKHFSKSPIKGEMILLIPEQTNSCNQIDIQEMIILLQKYFGLSVKEAIKKAAKISKINKREIYSNVVNQKKRCQ